LIWFWRDCHILCSESRRIEHVLPLGYHWCARQRAVGLLPAVADGAEAFAAVAVVTPTAKSPAVSTAAGMAFRRIDRPQLLVTVTIRPEPLSRGLESMTSPSLCGSHKIPDPRRILERLAAQEAGAVAASGPSRKSVVNDSPGTAQFATMRMPCSTVRRDI
jgi:hypothetical protein